MVTHDSHILLSLSGLTGTLELNHRRGTGCRCFLGRRCNAFVGHIAEQVDAEIWLAEEGTMTGGAPHRLHTGRTGSQHLLELDWHGSIVLT